MSDQPDVYSGQRFLEYLDDALIALSSAGADPGGRAAYILQALQLLRGDMMSCARAVLTQTVAGRLAALCEYMCSRLHYAHVHGVDAPFAEVIRLLEDLRRAWPSLDRTRTSLPRTARESA
jgi:flagellin-specific chaperone FliS